MAQYFWNSTSSSDPLVGANWTKSDGTSGVVPGSSDDVYLVPVSGVTLANIWASGGVGNPPTSVTSSGGSTAGGHLADLTQYFYKVTALYANGESIPSSEMTYTTGNSGTNVNQVTVNWVAPTTGGTPTGYKIYRGTTTNQEQYLATVGAVLSYADTTATVPQGGMPGSITFLSLTISSGFNQTIGNSGVGGYWKIGGATTWTIGAPIGGGAIGTGSGRIKIDFGSGAFTGTVFATGTTTDTGQDPVRILGSSASNVLNVMGGRVSVANNAPGETANVSGGLNVSGTGAICTCGSGVTWNTANVSAGGSLTTNSGTSGANPVASVGSGSNYTCNGSAKVASITNMGTVNHNVRLAGVISDSITNYGGATLNFANNPATGTVTLITASGPQASIVKRSPANPAHITITTLTTPDSGTLQVSA